MKIIKALRNLYLPVNGLAPVEKVLRRVTVTGDVAAVHKDSLKEIPTDHYLIYDGKKFVESTKAAQKAAKEAEKLAKIEEAKLAEAEALRVSQEQEDAKKIEEEEAKKQAEIDAKVKAEADKKQKDTDKKPEVKPEKVLTAKDILDGKTVEKND